MATMTVEALYYNKFECVFIASFEKICHLLIGCCKARMNDGYLVIKKNVK